MADLPADPAGEERPQVPLSRVTVPKASDVLADHLRQQIRDGTLAEGTALPVERELAAAVGLGRQTVRDALRVLEIEGLVVTRAGRAGGSFVRRPDAGTLERNLHALVSGRGVRFRSLLEAREALEPAAARLAALHHTEADVRMLEESAARLSAATGDIPTFLQCNTDWHVAIATASHNEIIEAVVSSLSRVILRSTDVDEFNSASTMAVTLKAHDRILAAIRAGDGDRAAAAMSKHVHSYRELVETYDVPEDVRL